MRQVLRLISPGSVLVLLGRNGALAMVAAVIAGLSLPETAIQLKPALPVAMALATLGAFLSASYSVERSWLQSYVLVVIVWVAIAPAIIVGTALRFIDVETGLLSGIMLATLAPPSSAVPPSRRCWACRRSWRWSPSPARPSSRP